MNAVLPLATQKSAPIEDEESFLASVRAFLAESLTEDLREAGRQALGVHADFAACTIWQRRLYERGWIAPTWPVEWGGTGWTTRQRFLFERECALNDAPMLFSSGLRSLGPLIIERGTPQQQQRYLKRMLSGEDTWCQGFSEPGAGSDLAAVNTRAVRDGDHYVIDGAKIWTTAAHHATHMFALVRTERSGRPREGITFLLLDMKSPGVSVTPIIDLAGQHEINAVHFEGVRAHVDDRVGAENEGWAVAKRLMELARSNNSPSYLVRRVLHRARLALAEAPEPDLVRRLAELEIALEAFAALEFDALPSGRPTRGGATSSMLKLTGSELLQQVAAFALDIAGPAAAAESCHPLLKYLSVRAATIYSGTSETHRNIIARDLLGTLRAV